MTDLTKPTDLDGRVWAESGTITSPATLDILEGWEVGEKPPAQFFNYWQNRTDKFLSYLMQKGIPEWDINTLFIANKSFVTQNGNVYLAKQTHSGQNPSLDITFVYWRLLINGATDLTLADIDSFIDYPSQNILGLGRNYFDVKVPNVGSFIDNVFSVQNLSDNGTIYGNAAIAFLDAAGTERGAVGYSRNNAIQPSGYYADTLYLEIGNPFTTDTNPTHLRVINTIAAGSPYWGGAAKSYFPIEVRSDTGAITFDGQGALTDFRNTTVRTQDLAVGDISTGANKISVAMTNTAARLREYGFSNSFAVTTNVSNLNAAAITKDDGTKSAWKVSFGHGDGATPVYDSFKVSRASSAATVWSDLLTLDSNGRVMVGQSGTASGADGSIAATGVAGAPAISARVSGAQYAGIIYNTATSGDNLLLAFGTEASYTQRGSVTYNRAGGLTAYNTTSDYRAKEIKGVVTNALEKISLLKPKTGRMVDAEQDIEFFIAHELQEVVPSAVTGIKDAVDEEGNPIYQMVDKSTLIPLLVASIQELSNIIKEQQKRIDVLESKVK